MTARRLRQVLFSQTKDGAAAVGTLAEGEWADVKVTISAARSPADRRVPRQGRGADGRPLAVRLFHTSVTPRDRDLARARRARLHRRLRRVPGAAVPDLDGGRLRGPRVGHRQRGDVRRAGPLLVDRPPCRCSSTSPRPTSRTSCWSACPRPTSSSTSSSAWSPDGAGRRPEPGLRRRRQVNGDARRPRRRARGVHQAAYEESGPDAGPRARILMGKDPTTFVSSDHGFAPQFLAIDASKALVDLGLLSRPQTSNCRPGRRRDDRQGQGLLGRRRRRRST